MNRKKKKNPCLVVLSSPLKSFSNLHVNTLSFWVNVLKKWEQYYTKYKYIFAYCVHITGSFSSTADKEIYHFIC